MTTAPMSEYDGWRDAHVHLHELGAELSCVNLADCPSLDECLSRIAAAAQDRPESDWIFAVRGRVEGWREPKWPTASQLHEAARGRPCVVRSFDHHALIASDAALRLAGVDASTPAPDRGVIERDAATGEPTGLLLERACRLVDAIIPRPSLEERADHLRLAIDEYTRRGCAEIHDMLSHPWLVEALGRLTAAGELGIDLWLYAPPDELEAVEKAVRELKCDRVHLAGAKFFLDGTLNSRTAKMLAPYAEPRPEAPCGTALLEGRELEAAIRRCDALGYPAAMHAIGDAAVRSALDAIEQVKPRTQGWRIEHCEFIDEADVPRFAKLGVVASLQPSHLLTDIEALQRLTPDRIDRAFPLRDLLDVAHTAGMAGHELLWLGTDAPVVDPDPAEIAQAATQRRRVEMNEDQSLARAQRITKDECLACMMPRDAVTA